jgi:hypothetical protein
MEATACAVGNGQLILHLLAPLLAGLLLLRRRTGWQADRLAAALLVVALAKPTVSLPFLWLAFFRPGGWRPRIFVGLIYGSLTAIAVAYQKLTLPALWHDWLMRASMVEIHEGYANLSTWLFALGHGEWAIPAALLALLALGCWIHGHRRVDPWLVIGVTAVVARLCIYHRIYDDVLIVLPIVAVFRIARHDAAAGRVNVAAELLLALAVLASLIPWWMLAPGAGCAGLVGTGMASVWIALLHFLLQRARSERRMITVDNRSSGCYNPINLTD